MRAPIEWHRLFRLRELVRNAVFVMWFGSLASAMSVTLTPSIPSPSGVGARVTWNASSSEDGAIWYRFQARRIGQPYQIIRDFGPVASLDWTAVDHEGWFEIQVSARNIGTGETAETSALYEMVSRVTGNRPVVNPTSHPLVFLYSAGPCRRGEMMRVDFAAPGSPTMQTPYRACDSQSSMNFYLAGLRPETTYAAHYVLAQWGVPVSGPDSVFTTGSLPPGLVTETALKTPPGNVSNEVLLGSSLYGVSVATNLSGTVLWYGPDDLSYLTRPEAGGVFWGLSEAQGADPSNQFIRKFDVAGIPLLETNAARVNEQLSDLGYRQITAFHHEVRTLPDGRIAALADVEQILTDVQGPGPVDVIGDMIIVFDSQLKVLWAWDTFDHLDVTRQAVLGETCPALGSCAPYTLAASANDWTHGNSVSQTADGQLLYSSRHQDWLIKIAYENGHGDGHVIWRLGKDGDFLFNSTGSYPWFSHQHDANFEASDPSKLLVFDDGNTRVATLQSGNSRGQVIQLNERNRAASLVLNADLGVYSGALGSAQKLRDGDYSFDAGLVFGQHGLSAYSIEVNGSGDVVGKIQASKPLYRSFRMVDLYTPN